MESPSPGRVGMIRSFMQRSLSFPILLFLVSMRSFLLSSSRPGTRQRPSSTSTTTPYLLSLFSLVLENLATLSIRVTPRVFPKFNSRRSAGNPRLGQTFSFTLTVLVTEAPQKGFTLFRGSSPPSFSFAEIHRPLGNPPSPSLNLPSPKKKHLSDLALASLANGPPASLFSPSSQMLHMSSRELFRFTLVNIGPFLDFPPYKSRSADRDTRRSRSRGFTTYFFSTTCSPPLSYCRRSPLTLSLLCAEPFQTAVGLFLSVYSRAECE